MSNARLLEVGIDKGCLSFFVGVVVAFPFTCEGMWPVHRVVRTLSFREKRTTDIGIDEEGPDVILPYICGTVFKAVGMVKTNVMHPGHPIVTLN